MTDIDAARPRAADRAPRPVRSLYAGNARSVMLARLAGDAQHELARHA